MTRTPPPLDEYTLAAFLAGTLPPERRAEVMASLADNEDARELLCMAEEALAAAPPPVAAPFTDPASEAPPPPPVPSKAAPPDRAPRPSSSRRRVRFGHLLVGTVLVLLLGIGIQFSLRPPAPDRFRSGDEAVEAPFEAEVSMPGLAFRWTEVPEAYYYRVVVLDPQAAQVLGQHETRAVQLPPDDAFVVALRTKIVPGRPYSFRVDAMDAQNRLVQSSPSVLFELPH